MDYCARCDERIRIKSPDPAFCRGCFDALENVVDRTRALVCIANANSHNKELRMKGFLGIFHPELSDEAVYRISREEA